MLQFQFVLTDNNKMSLAVSKHRKNYVSGRINILGDYLKECRLKNNMTKPDVAKKLGFNNINKTVRLISEIEENSIVIPEYVDRLISLYGIDKNHFNLIRREHGERIKELQEKAVRDRLSFYLSLIDKLPFLYENYEKIIEDDRYYFCSVPDAYVSTAFIGRERDELYLGELLVLWKNGDWIAECPECGGRVYITNIGGSPLSGRGSAWGVCNGCKKFVYKITPFSRYFRQVIKVPIRRIPEFLSPVSFETLLKELGYYG